MRRAWRRASRDDDAGCLGWFSTSRATLERVYRLHLPRDPPAALFWAVNLPALYQRHIDDLVATLSRLMDPALCAEFCEEYTRQRNALRGAKNAQLASARSELTKLAKDRERLIEAIKAGVPATEVKDDLARIAARREELEALLANTKDETVILHPDLLPSGPSVIGRALGLLR